MPSILELFKKKKGLQEERSSADAVLGASQSSKTLSETKERIKRIHAPFHERVENTHKLLEESGLPSLLQTEAEILVKEFTAGRDSVNTYISVRFNKKPDPFDRNDRATWLLYELQDMDNKDGEQQLQERMKYYAGLEICYKWDDESCRGHSYYDGSSITIMFQEDGTTIIGSTSISQHSWKKDGPEVWKEPLVEAFLKPTANYNRPEPGSGY